MVKENTYIERYENKIYLYYDGIIMMIVDDIGQTDQNIIDSYVTIVSRIINSDK